MSRSAAALGAALVVGAAGPAHTARAAACCGGISSSEPFALPKFNQATAGVALSFEDDLGTRSSDGTSLGTGSWGSQDAHLVVGGVLRLGPDLQAGLSVPGVFRAVQVAQDHGTAVGLGDLALNGRWEIHDDDMCYLRRAQGWSPKLFEPSVHAVVHATLPTGRWQAREDDITGASITGRGYASVDAGLDLTKIWGVLGTNLSATGGWLSPVPSLVGGRPAVQWSAAVGLMAFYRYKSFLSLSASHHEELALQGGRLSTSGLSLSLAHYDLAHDNRYLLGLSAMGLPPARSTPIGWQAGVSWSHMF